MRKAFQLALARSVADFYYFDAVHVDASIWDVEEDFSEELFSFNGNLLPS